VGVIVGSAPPAGGVGVVCCCPGNGVTVDPIDGPFVGCSVAPGVTTEVAATEATGVSVGVVTAVFVGCGVEVAVKVGVDVNVCVGGAVFVAVGLLVGVAVLVAVAVAVGVSVGVSDGGTGVSVYVNDGAAVTVASGVGVSVCAGSLDTTTLRVAVGIAFVGVRVAVGRNVADGSGVSVAVGRNVGEASCPPKPKTEPGPPDAATAVARIMTKAAMAPNAEPTRRERLPLRLVGGEATLAGCWPELIAEAVTGMMRVPTDAGATPGAMSFLPAIGAYADGATRVLPVAWVSTERKASAAVPASA